AGLSGVQQYNDSVIDENNILTMDPGNKERNFDRRNFRIGDAELDQFSGAFNYSNPIAGTGAEVYAFGDFSMVENESGGFYRRANQLDRNPMTSIYPDGFLPLINTTVTDFSIGGGFVSEFENNLKADVAVVHGGNSFNFEVTNSHNASWVALNCASRATCNAQTTADAGTLSLDLTTINVDFTLPLGDSLHLAWGLEHRLDRYRIEAGEEYSNLDYDGPGVGGGGGIQVFPGFKPENEVDELRSAFSLYMDTEFYVSDTFLISPAVRVENYSDFGSTINGKVATKFDLSGEFALRGSVSSGFRAPSMQQLYFNNISTQFRNVDGEQVAFEVGTFRNDSDLAKAVGIPELDAETSVTGSVGFVYQPVPEFTLTTDFYLINISDRIIISNQFDADTEGIPDSVQNRIREAGGDRGQFFMNAADTQTQGVDIVATWDVPFVTRGDLGLKLLATVSETEITSINLPVGLPDALFTEQDRSIVEEWQPSYRLTLSGSYALDRFSGALAIHGYGPYTVLDGQRQEYDARYLTDLRLGYSLAFGRISIGANNLFNVTPEENEVGQSRGGTIIAPDGTVIVDSPGVFTYSRRSAPFGFNGGFYYLAYDVEF
ncbi:MAG: TonB-dependent receptor, partial [Candidatus Tectomicrobia bacterium]|nr:TonB-dependent receptor [Candidatus Tectomicrobia bacterium]